MTNKDSLYLQYMPDKHALDRVAEFQGSLSSLGNVSRPVKPTVMHLTILHFGYLEDTFQQLRLVNAQLSWDRYAAAVERLKDMSKPLLPTEVTVQPAQLSLFGPHKTVLALQMARNPELDQAHRDVLQALSVFLRLCGIDDSTALPHRPRALQLSPVLSPHISLFKAADATEKPWRSARIPEQELRLQLFPF